MQLGFEGRAEYLSLAMFAQNIVAELAMSEQRDDLAKLRTMLEEARLSLNDIQSGDVKRFGRRDAAAFKSYQQISALRKAWSEDDRSRAILLISTLIQDPTEDYAAQQLAELFTKLQVQALWSFDHPDSPPTEGLRRLCQTAP